jgi:hypothetical protein
LQAAKLTIGRDSVSFSNQHQNILKSDLIVTSAKCGFEK